MAQFELQARYDDRKSFYGKAIVVEDDNHTHLILKSYGTEVAEIRNGEVVYADIGKWSTTTNRHIREFVRQFANDGCR